MDGTPPDEYAEINSPLERWASKNNLRWAKEYKDYRVRSFDLTSLDRADIQVWVDPPHSTKVTIHAAINNSVRSRIVSQQATVEIGALEQGLDEAYRVAREWAETRR